MIAPTSSRPSPAGHQLAGKEAVNVADLAAEHLLQDPDDVPEWRDIAVELRERQPRGRVPRPRTVEEKLEYVAAGNGVVILPQSAASFYNRPDITLVPVSDIAPSQVCLAWDSTRRSALIGEYVAIVHGRALQEGAQVQHARPVTAQAGGHG
jgi:DNA-binding transcriptional LysR family regulator